MSAYLSLDCLELVCPFYHFFPFFLSFSCLFPCFIGRLFIPFYLRCSHHRFLSFFFLSVYLLSLSVCLFISFSLFSLFASRCLLASPLPPPPPIYISLACIPFHSPHFPIHFTSFASFSHQVILFFFLFYHQVGNPVHPNTANPVMLVMLSHRAPVMLVFTKSIMWHLYLTVLLWCILLFMYLAVSYYICFG